MKIMRIERIESRRSYIERCQRRIDSEGSELCEAVTVLNTAKHAEKMEML